MKIYKRLFFKYVYTYEINKWINKLLNKLLLFIKYDFVDLSFL